MWLLVILLVPTSMVLFSVHAFSNKEASQEPMKEIMEKPVATIMQRMEAMVIPASNALWDVSMNAPKSNEEWMALRNEAVVLAEAGNLLLTESLALKRKPWIEAARVLRDAGAAALEAIKVRD